MAGFSGFSGAWAAQSQNRTIVPLHPQRDPQHLDPSPDPNLMPGQTPDWVQSANAPTLPEALDGGVADPPMPTGYGPIDHTPFDHSYGLGIQPGLSTLDNQDIGGVWHNDDQGTVAAESYVHPVMRDGAPHVAWIDHEPEPVDSMGQVEYQRVGVGAVHDPNAVRGKRLKRWYDRFIEMHRYGVELRPYAPNYAHPSPERLPAQNADQVVSPYPNAAAAYSGPPNRFVLPMTRREPQDWVTSQTEDGTSETLYGAATHYGLPSWGL